MCNEDVLFENALPDRWTVWKVVATIQRIFYDRVPDSLCHARLDNANVRSLFQRIRMIYADVRIKSRSGRPDQDDSPRPDFCIPVNPDDKSAEKLPIFHPLDWIISRLIPTHENGHLLQHRTKILRRLTTGVLASSSEIPAASWVATPYEALHEKKRIVVCIDVMTTVMCVH